MVNSNNANRRFRTPRLIALYIGGNAQQLFDSAQYSLLFHLRMLDAERNQRRANDRLETFIHQIVDQIDRIIRRMLGQRCIIEECSVWNTHKSVHLIEQFETLVLLEEVGNEVRGDANGRQFLEVKERRVLLRLVQAVQLQQPGPGIVKRLVRRDISFQTS